MDESKHREEHIISQGAEGKIYKTSIKLKETVGSSNKDDTGYQIAEDGEETPCIAKERFVKKYRVPELDAKITKTRILQETRNIDKIRKAGVNAPKVYILDQETRRIYMELFEDPIITVKEYLLPFESFDHEKITVNLCKKMGEYIAKMHMAHIIHGDLTTSNMMVNKNSLKVCIIFV